jgi:hypothetical protein
MKFLILYFIFFYQISANAQLLTIGNSTPDYSFRPQGEITQLKNLSKVKNQSDAEECFLFAFLTYWETAEFNRRGERIAPISAPYLTVRKFQMYIDDMLTYGNSAFSLEGGLTQDLFLVINKYGIVAEQSWKPKKTFRYWEMAPVYNNIKESIKKWQPILKKARTSFGEDSIEYLTTLEQAKVQTFRFVTEVSGELPERVIFQGQEVSPLEMREYYRLHSGLTIQWMYSVAKWHEDHVGYVRSSLIGFTRRTQSRFRTEASRWADMLDEIIENIDNQEPALVGFSWDRSGGHMLTIIGYLVENNKITHLKFQNSWGTSWGRDGTGWVATSDLAKRADETWWIYY